MRTRAIMLLAAGLLGLSVLAGCGDDGDGEALDPGSRDSGATSSETSTETTSPTPTESSEPPEETPSVTPDPLPACADVWVGGQKLPAKYKGCESMSGPVKAKKYPCSFGSSIVTFDDRFYAQLGRPINEVDSLKSSNAFQSALKACQA
jgi:hypothetical protein